VDNIAKYLYNALEYAADCSEIREIKEKMLENDALGALMTGSGSAVFGIFDNKRDAKKCVKELEDDYIFCKTLKPVPVGVEIIEHTL